jgi:Helix-turn-helix.
MEKRGPRLVANRKQQKVFLSLLRDLRRKAGLRQTDVAEALGKPQAFVSYYESGARRLDLLELRQVCHALGVPLLEFVRQFERTLRDSSSDEPRRAARQKRRGQL